MKKNLITWIFCLSLSSCLFSCAQLPQLQSEPGEMLTSVEMASLPIAISNNAVATASVDGESRLYSFLGLEEGKEWDDVSRKVFRYSGGSWTQLTDVPVKDGRLASVAVTVRNQIYLFGGYTVAEDHHEVSTPEVLRFDPLLETYDRAADIPIPSDDAVALVYQDRYIYLISGWHDKGNINLVQVYDVETDSWKQASQFPGSPVFGHAGGIVGSSLVICDGVKIKYPVNTQDQSVRRDFVMSNECYKGQIDEKDPYRIHWYILPSHGKMARYRMAATGDNEKQWVIFVGGSDNPYNFNGIGYNGEPSVPDGSVFAYSLKEDGWLELGSLTQGTMDHRSLLKHNDAYVVVGGMGDAQKVLKRTYQIKLEE